MVEIGQRNVEIARKGYKAFEEGDIQTVMELLADNVVWHVSGRNPLSGDYRGKQAVMELFGKYMGMVDSQGTEVHDILANDQHTIFLGTLTVEREGKKIEVKVTDVIHPDSEGRVEEFWRFVDDPYAFDELIS